MLYRKDSSYSRLQSNVHQVSALKGEFKEIIKFDKEKEILESKYVRIKQFRDQLESM